MHLMVYHIPYFMGEHAGIRKFSGQGTVGTKYFHDKFIYIYIAIYNCITINKEIKILVLFSDAVNYF